jgi:CRISPR-associated protein (TIGR03986 family)
MITAPYNFVPLNEKVFYPNWAEDVSHDIPFEDGESGVIEIDIEAKSPIFIRNHSNDKDKPSTEFCHQVMADGSKQFYIPGSSIKGMVRSVMEIMSFAKMRKELFDDNTYAVRDLSDAKNFYMSKMKPENTFCGWLKKVDDNYIIENCGIPGRISQDEIDKALNIDFASNFEKGKFDVKDQTQKTAEYKYDLISDTNHNISVNGPFFSKKNKKYDKREFYNYSKDAAKVGKLVVTGQPSPRINNDNKREGKGFEFLFFDKIEEITIDKKVFENFKFAYFDKRETQPKESPDWTYWKNRLKNGEKVPVFFQKAERKIESFGLSYLYKLPYKYSIKDGIFNTHFEDGLDLVQTMFGFIDKKDNQALKGRVYFSHLKADSKSVKESHKRVEVLGSPRASYYPNYIDQENQKLYTTYMDPNFHISGRKRYPIHKSNNPAKHKSENENENVGTSFCPLEQGAIFNGKVRFHNLKKAELGALLSALTFHNTKDTYHNIGMAKPLGYGKIKISVNGIEDIEKYLQAFESEITTQIPEWIDSSAIQELLTMATQQNNNNNSSLRYMKLEDFAKNKNNDNRNYLKKYTKLDQIQPVKSQTMLSEDEIKDMANKIELAKKERQEYLSKLEKERKYKSDFTIIENSKNIAQLEAFLSKYPNAKDFKDIEERVKFLKDKEIADKEAKQKEEEQKKLNLIAKKEEENRKTREEEEQKKREKLEKGLDFSQANDVKGIERALKGFEKSDENIQQLIDGINSIYPTLNKKKKNQLERSKELEKWLTKEGFNKLISSLSV